MLVLILIIVIGGVVVGATARRHRRLLAVRRTPTTTVEQLAILLPGDAGSREVAGTARAGPGGPLTAPLSGRPCVWYRLRVTDRSRRPFAWGRRARTAVCDVRSDAPFTLDDGSGRIRVDVRDADMAPGPPVVSTREIAVANTRGFAAGTLAARTVSGRLPGMPPPIRPGAEYDYREWVLDEGDTAYALGAVRHDDGGLTLGAADRVPHVVGAGSEQRIRAELRRRLLIGYGAGIPMVVLGLTVLGFGLAAIITG